MSTIETQQAVTNRRPIDLGGALREGGRRFLDDILPLVLATLIVAALSVLTLGILAGPLYAGMLNMVIERMRDGKQPRVGDVFSCLDRFWAFLGAAILLAVTIGLASLTIVGGVLLAAIWFYTFPLMIDRRMGLIEALHTSKDMVLRTGFWEHVALVIVLIALGALGRGPLFLLTVPFGAAVTVASYAEARTR